MTRHRGQRQTLSAYAPEPGSPRAPGPLPTSGTPPAARHAGGDLGHPQRLVAAAQVWSFAGFDPVTQQSGDFRRVSHISRKDDPGLRDTLFLKGRPSLCRSRCWRFDATRAAHPSGWPPNPHVSTPAAHRPGQADHHCIPCQGSPQPRSPPPCVSSLYLTNLAVTPRSTC